MEILRRFTTLLAIVFILSSCSSVRPITVSTTQKDSIYIKEVLRDTIVRVETDSSMIQALIECDSLGRAHLKQLISYVNGERLNPPTIVIKDNILTSTVKTDSLAIYLALKDTYKTDVKVRTETKIVEVNILTWWQRYWIKSGKIVTGTILIMVILFVVKLCIKRRI